MHKRGRLPYLGGLCTSAGAGGHRDARIAAAAVQNPRRLVNLGEL